VIRHKKTLLLIVLFVAGLAFSGCVVGGGCRAPIAALGIASGTTLDLEGMIADVSGKKILRALEKGSVTLPEEVGVRLAQKILGMGASEFITEARVR
jgi:hydroxymethylbilane synthase